MKFLTDIDELKDKTITRAQFFDCEKSVFVEFSDDTAIIFNATTDYDGIPEVRIVGENTLSMCEKRELGIITEKEFDDWSNKLERERKEKRRAQELMKLAELKAKYEG